MRYITMLGILAAALGLIFHLAHLAGDVEVLLLFVAVLLVGIGVVTGT